MGGISGFGLIWCDENRRTGVELLFHHSFAEDSHALLIGRGVENLVRWEVWGFCTHGHAGAGGVLDKDEVAKEGGCSPSEKALALRFSEIVAAAHGFFASVVGIVSVGGAAEGFQLEGSEQAFLEHYQQVPLLGGPEKSGQDDHRFSAMNFTAFGAVAIDDINNHIAEGIQIFPASDSAPVSLVQFSGGLLLGNGIPSASPEEANGLPESFLVVDQWGGHELVYAVMIAGSS